MPASVVENLRHVFLVLIAMALVVLLLLIFIALTVVPALLVIVLTHVSQRCMYSIGRYTRSSTILPGEDEALLS